MLVAQCASLVLLHVLEADAVCGTPLDDRLVLLMLVDVHVAVLSLPGQ